MKIRKTSSPIFDNHLHRMVLEAIKKVTTPEALLVEVLRRKLMAAGVRLKTAEMNRLKQSAHKLMETFDAAVLAKAVPRSAGLSLHFGQEDVDEAERIFSERVDLVTKISVERLTKSMARSIRDWGKEQVEWNRRIQTGFEKRLARTWKTAFEHYDRFRQLAAYTGQLAMARFNEEAEPDDRRSSTALLMLHARACAVSAEVAVLMRAGQADGADARWRTIHEIAIVCSFLVEHGEDAADRYLSHLPCEQLVAARLYAEHCQRLGQPALDPKTIPDLEKAVNALGDKYGKFFKKEWGWAAKALGQQRVTFRDIEGSTKMAFMRPYYRSASEQVHASSTGAVERAGLIQQDLSNLTLVAGASNYGFADAGQNTARALLIATVCLGQAAGSVDVLVMLKSLADWYDTLAMRFVITQRKIEERERQIRARRGAMVD